MTNRSLLRITVATLAGSLLGPLLAAVAPAAPAGADDGTIPPLCFPVEGASFFGSPPSTSLATTYWTDTFGAPRSGHSHEGQDIMSVRGVKMRHLLAAADGTVIEQVFNNATGNRTVIRGDDGWFYVYIHVNNDSPGTDDGSATRAQAFAPGVSQGTHVVAGQFIGYLGDSGNAESAGAHNHFEVRMPSTNTASWAWSSATAVNSATALQDAMAHPERCAPGGNRFAPFTGNPEFVDRQYRDFLGRAPDTSGRNTWLDAIYSDRQSMASFIGQLLASPEFEAKIAPIARLYKAYFLRTPDTDGLEYWVGQYRSGKTLAWISNYFAGSQEFTDRYGSLANRAFVDQIYVNVLGREGEQSGVDYWTDRLDRNTITRGEVMLQFSESAENKGLLENWVRVVLIYIGMLDRAPDPGGLDYWSQVDDPTALINGFLASDEYANRIAALRTAG